VREIGEFGDQPGRREIGLPREARVCFRAQSVWLNARYKLVEAIEGLVCLGAQ
jgi:hypothetical protein